MASDDDFDCEDKSVPRADHIELILCGHGTIFIRLFDKGGRCFAMAPFCHHAAAELADGLIQACERVVLAADQPVGHA